MVWYIVASLVINVLFGFGTQGVIDSKGIEENWFWWGFFFGIIALLVALSKPNTYLYRKKEDDGGAQDAKILAEGGWKCTCGRVNPAYASSCSCGKSRFVLPETDTAPSLDEEERKLKILKDYKALLDAGTITEREFESKKRELLG